MEVLKSKTIEDLIDWCELFSIHPEVRAQFSDLWSMFRGQIWVWSYCKEEKEKKKVETEQIQSKVDLLWLSP